MVLCKQDQYVACFDITEENCGVELKPINRRCLEDMNVKYGTLSCGENERLYIRGYGKCLISKHLESRGYIPQQCNCGVRLDISVIVKVLLED